MSAQTAGMQPEQLPREMRQLQDMLRKSEAATQNALRRSEQLERERNAAREAGMSLHSEMDVVRKCLGQTEQRAKDTARSLDAITRERDKLTCDLATMTQKHAAAQDLAAFQAKNLAQNATEQQQMQEQLRLADIQLKSAQQDMMTLKANAQNAAALRKEIQILEHDLVQERMKSQAFGEEMEKPMNVHRWRHLEGSDPAAHELILQIQTLQRRLISITEASMAKSLELQEKEQLCAELKAQLASRPGPEVLQQVSNMQGKLTAQTKKMKALTAEMRMRDTVNGTSTQATAPTVPDDCSDLSGGETADD